jgi:hypothetical protein
VFEWVCFDVCIVIVEGIVWGLDGQWIP